jgi:hypothetical protein
LHESFEFINFADYVDFEEAIVPAARLRHPISEKGFELT